MDTSYPGQQGPACSACSHSVSVPSACTHAGGEMSVLSATLQSDHSTRGPSHPGRSGRAAGWLFEKSRDLPQSSLPPHLPASHCFLSHAAYPPSSTTSVLVRSQWLRLRLWLSGCLPSFCTNCLTRPQPTTGPGSVSKVSLSPGNHTHNNDVRHSSLKDWEHSQGVLMIPSHLSRGAHPLCPLPPQRPRVPFCPHFQRGGRTGRQTASADAR